MYLGLINSTCCIIMFAIMLLVIDQQIGFSDNRYVEVGSLIKFFKSLV